MKIFTNLAFWAAVSGFIGTIFIYFFGLPEPINSDGHINLALEQVDENQIRVAAIYARYSGVGLLLVCTSFALQLIDIIRSKAARDASV